MSRQLCITSVDGHTGFLIAELILTDNKFKKAIGTVTGLTLHPDAPFCKELSKLGAKIVPHRPGRLRDMVSSLQEVGADTMCLIPPAHTEKFDITAELIEATKKANVPNVCFLSSAGCDLAERDKQPRLREFIDLEARFMASKGDPSTSTGHSPVIIRCVVKSWLLILSYPGWPSVQLTYQSKVLHAQSESDESEVQYLLEYYSLVREGKTNYISTTAFHDVTGGHPQEPPDFFKTYAQEFHAKRGHKKRKLSADK
ncbi:unnamed protein product [Aspergillus oryzae var. brunneus]|uniref:Unnamed protein product n=1 Tax=Aspergillus oryzae var. brunneus TaxID=332754 RepID=A0ABQ6LDD1_ASPOZ|nr:unnamed protein product [Aspergillus oryzae]GMG54237.1 unnamed protein product [Aspergillus oryzae var. brunneus]